MTSWEYKTIKMDFKGAFIGGVLDVAKFDVMLNGLGCEGWELVAAFDSNMYPGGASREAIAIFKRARN